MLEQFTSPLNRTSTLQQPGAYVIIHKTSKRFYIGSTSDLYGRKLTHESELRRGVHPNHRLQRAYDSDPNLLFLIYPTDDREEAYRQEQELLDRYFPQNMTFNIAKDAKVSLPGMGAVFTEEHRQRISQARMGITLSAETRAKVSQTKRSKSRKLSIGGVIYDGMMYAVESLGITYATIYWRLNSREPQWSEWFWLDTA
jgi:predicted GIY-YIG superfamily endonuclease